MNIPQLNAEQVQDLKGMCGPISAFSQVVPNEKLDGENYAIYMDKVRDTEQLLILGLIKEVTETTEEIKEKLANLYIMTSRMFRVFEITEVGLLMFGGPEKKYIN